MTQQPVLRIPRYAALVGHEDDIGAWVTALREKKKISQRELARRAGYDPSTINRIENGKQIPDVHHLHTIAQALGTRLIITTATGDAGWSSERPKLSVEDAALARDFEQALPQLGEEARTMIAAVVARALAQT